MARLIAAFDWSRTSLGPPADWPQCLKTTIALMLRSQIPMVLLWGADGIMTYNDPYSVFAGSRHPSLLGSRVREGWSEVADFNDNVMRVGLAGGTLHYEDQELILHRDGVPGQCWTNLDYSPVLDDAGTPAGVLAIVVETTGKVLAERATKKAALWLRSYIAASSDVFYRVNADWSEIIELDGRGFVADAAMPTANWMSVYIHTADEPLLRATIAAAIAAKGLFELEHRVRQADGNVGWTFSRAVPLFDNEGEITEWFGVASDITERKRRATLEAAQNRVLALAIQDTPLSAPLDALVRSVEDHAATGLMASILVMDADGRHLRHGAAPSLPEAYNQAIDGIEVGEGVGSCGTAAHRKSPVYVDDIGCDPLWADFRDLAATHGLCACWSVPILSGAGKVLGTFAIYHRDCRAPKDGDLKIVEFVTRSAALAIEHKRAVDDLRRSRAELEQRVLERSVELEKAHDALRQSQKMEAVGQLTGGIAHDFNNMLAVVIGSLDLLRRRVGDSDARALRYADAATDGARRATQLTQRLLAFSRQQPLKPTPLDPNRLVAGMSDLFRHSLGTDVQLETVLAGGIWRIHADPNQLENVLLNLAVNARDAMPGGGRLTIETQNAHLDERYVAAHLGVPPGQYVLMAVTDTGSGMSQDTMSKAFDPFFTTKEVGKGTGLGLSQAYGFVKQSGGHVKIYSEIGEGTTIKVYLPRFLGDAAQIVDSGSTEDLPLGDDQEVILIVEDEPAVRQFSADALTTLGYRVLEADGAAAALRLLDIHAEIALLFTDVVMPEVNGAKLAEEVRRRRPDVKILFTTGYTRNAIVHNGVLDAGVQMIAKPFTLDELAAKLRDVLDSA